MSRRKDAIITAMHRVSGSRMSYSCLALDDFGGPDLAKEYAKFFDNRWDNYWDWADGFDRHSDKYLTIRQQERLTCLALFLVAGGDL